MESRAVWRRQKLTHERGFPRAAVGSAHGVGCAGRCPRRPGPPTLTTGKGTGLAPNFSADSTTRLDNCCGALLVPTQSGSHLAWPIAVQWKTQLQPNVDSVAGGFKLSRDTVAGGSCLIVAPGHLFRVQNLYCLIESAEGLMVADRS